MKILIVNTTDSGGAANSCVRLHLGLLQQGVDSKLLVLEQYREIPQTFVYKTPYVRKTRWQRAIAKLCNTLGINRNDNIQDKVETKRREYLQQRSKGLEMFSFPESSYDITNSFYYQEADIVNLHWVAGFINYSDFFGKNTKPIVWTLHDMNPFSGGDHFNEEYSGISDSGIPIKRELTALEVQTMQTIYSLKEKAIAQVKNLTVVAPSLWLTGEAKQSKVFKNRRIQHIAYGLDSNTFMPYSKDEVRKELNIPADKIVLLFVAESIDNQRKGFVYLERALAGLDDPRVLLCSVGLHGSAMSSTNPVFQLGRIEDPITMSKAYAAADAFIIPSLMDNLPNTVLESLMCGTPVIGFPTGGIVDMIQPGENGYLCSKLSVDALRSTIDRFLENPLVFDPNTIRNNAVKKYVLSVQAKRYKELFSKILN